MEANKEDLMKKLDADREADHKELLARLEDDRQAERRFLKEMMQIMQTGHKEIRAVIEPGRNMETIACQEMEAHPEEEKPASGDMKPEAAEQQDATVMLVVEPEEEMSNTGEETMACQEMEERLEEEEPTSVDRKPEAAKEEVPKEDDVAKPVNGRKKRQRGKKQAAERCEEPEELTRGICGSRRKLAAACRKVSRRATVARRRRDAFKNGRTQDGCQRRLEAARRGTSQRAEMVRKMKADRKMPRRTTHERHLQA
jgi:hypothetical protein